MTSSATLEKPQINLVPDLQSSSMFHVLSPNPGHSYSHFWGTIFGTLGHWYGRYGRCTLTKRFNDQQSAIDAVIQGTLALKATDNLQAEYD